MKFGRLPSSGIRQLIRQNTVTKTLTRPDDSKDSRFGESRGGTTTVEVDVWLFNPEETPVQTDYGTREAADLSGLLLPSEDIQLHDQLDHGGETYEVMAPPTDVPNASSPNHVGVDLGRITNER